MQGGLTQFVEGVDGATAAEEFLYRGQVARLRGAVKSLLLKPIVHTSTRRSGKSARAWAALRAEEATLCRELRTLHRWRARPGRTARVVSPFHEQEHSYIGDFVSHPNDQPSSGGRVETLELGETSIAAAICCSAWFGYFAFSSATRANRSTIAPCWK